MVEIEKAMEATLLQVAEFYDGRKVGDVGNLGFRRSSDLSKVLSSLKTMISQRLFAPGAAHFLDLGCADGRVNVLLSYLAKTSVGIEIDDNGIKYLVIGCISSEWAWHPPWAPAPAGTAPPLGFAVSPPQAGERQAALVRTSWGWG